MRGQTRCFSNPVLRVDLVSQTLLFPLVSANDGKHVQTVVVKENWLNKFFFLLRVEQCRNVSLPAACRSSALL